MFTVLRFTSDVDNNQSLGRIAKLISEASEVSFDGMDHVPNRFSCSISDSSSFGDHVKAIRTCIESLRGIFSEASQLKVDCTFDIAIDITDLECTANYLGIGLEQSLLSDLVQANAALDITIYHNLPVDIEQLEDGSFAYFREGRKL